MNPLNDVDEVRVSSEASKSVKFKLVRETVEELGLEELSLVSGGATFSCCVGCNTDSNFACEC